MNRIFLCAFALAFPLSAAAQTVIPAGVPLRVQIDHRYRVKVGAKITGHLLAPVYSVDHKVLPVNTEVTGTILGFHPGPREGRLRRVLNAQFVEPRTPAVTFSAIRLPDGRTLPIRTSVLQRDATVIRMSSGKHPKLRERLRQQIDSERHLAVEAIHHPNLGDRLRKWIYAQLPWSPPTIWSNTQYDARLTAPISIPGKVPTPLPSVQPHGTPTGVLHARLTSNLNSGQDHRGTPVRAVLTAPLLTPNHQAVIFPEGTVLNGIVTLDQHARWFARNGRLRFTFRSVQLSHAPATAIHGQLAAAESAPGQNIKINDEGTARSTGGPGKYLAPMVLGVMTAGAYGNDATQTEHSAVISNGFGFAARIAAMVTVNVAVVRGFAYFALSKSIYFRWIARGHEVSFPQDTRLEIVLNPR